MNTKIRLLLTLDGFRIAAFGLLGPIYAIFVEKIGGDILDAGIAFSIYSMSMGILTYFIGKLGDRLKKPVNLLIFGHSIMAIVFFSYLLIRNPLQLMIVQLILGIGAAISDPIYDTIFSINLDTKKRYAEWADWESMNFIILGITAVIGAGIAKYLGFQVLFIAMGTSSLVSVVFALIFKSKKS